MSYLSTHFDTDLVWAVMNDSRILRKPIVKGGTQWSTGIYEVGEDAYVGPDDQVIYVADYGPIRPAGYTLITKYYLSRHHYRIFLNVHTVEVVGNEYFLHFDLLPERPYPLGDSVEHYRMVIQFDK